jgi:hypothetical protein
MNDHRTPLVLLALALLTACDAEPLSVPSAVSEMRVRGTEAQAEEACGEPGETCCEEETCAEGYDCSDEVCVYPFLEPQ